MIELIAPAHCPQCGEKMTIDDRFIAECPKEHTHIDRKCVVVYYHQKTIVLGVNMYLDDWQFSFQEAHMVVLNTNILTQFEDKFFPPIPVELDFNKLQHKLQTILTFG